MKITRMGTKDGIGLFFLVVSLVGMRISIPTDAGAAPWLAPAADEHITAQWVRDVAETLRDDRFQRVFMNQSFGCDQCAILNFLNDSAAALDGDKPKLAKSFMRRSLEVLDEGLEAGYYTEQDIRPIKELIVQKANQGLQEAGAGEWAFSVPGEGGQDPRYGQADDGLSTLSQESKSYGDPTDRWTGYTKNRRLGLTERSDVSERSRGVKGFDPYEEAY